MMYNNIYKLYANCIPVKGIKRSIIYDLGQGKFKFIPNLLFEILTDNSQYIDFNEIKKKFSCNRETVNNYTEFLLKNDFVFKTTKKAAQYFKDLEVTYESPYIIQNIVLEITNKSNYINNQLFLDFEKIGCIDLQIKFFDKVSINEVEDILIFTLNRRIKSIELIMPYCELLVQESNLSALIKRHQRITSLILYSSPKDLIEKLHEQYLIKGTSILFYKEKVADSDYCGFVSPRYFTINIPFFMESRLYNNCLNRKLSIDSEGTIKNCTALTKSYGNVKDNNLLEIISSSVFQKSWNIKKDDILICKNCEFRYMCSDCRAFTTDNDLRGKPSRCKYDPETMTWE